MNEIRQDSLSFHESEAIAVLIANLWLFPEFPWNDGHDAPLGEIVLDELYSLRFTLVPRIRSFSCSHRQFLVNYRISLKWWSWVSSRWNWAGWMIFAKIPSLCTNPKLLPFSWPLSGDFHNFHEIMVVMLLSVKLWGMNGIRLNFLSFHESDDIAVLIAGF